MRARVVEQIPAPLGDGDAVLLKIGTTPYRFVFLVYVAAYGQWVGGEEVIVTGVGTGSSTSYIELNFGPPRMVEQWRLYDSAGLKPQYKVALFASTDGTNAIFAAVTASASDDSATPNLVSVSQFAAVSTATHLRMLDSGWQDLPALALRDFIEVGCLWKQAASGLGLVANASVSRRWVSK
ncbi:MAG: hypothetical protein ACJ76I_11905 [Gaiellaceae bacterium]